MNLYAAEQELALVGFFGDNNGLAVDVYIKPVEVPLAEIELTASLLAEIE